MYCLSVVYYVAIIMCKLNKYAVIEDELWVSGAILAIDFPGTDCKKYRQGWSGKSVVLCLPGDIACNSRPHFVRAGTETARVADVVEC